MAKLVAHSTSRSLDRHVTFDPHQSVDDRKSEFPSTRFLPNPRFLMSKWCIVDMMSNLLTNLHAQSPIGTTAHCCSNLWCSLSPSRTLRCSWTSQYPRQIHQPLLLVFLLEILHQMEEAEKMWGVGCRCMHSFLKTLVPIRYHESWRWLELKK